MGLLGLLGLQELANKYRIDATPESFAMSVVVILAVWVLVEKLVEEFEKRRLPEDERRKKQRDAVTTLWVSSANGMLWGITYFFIRRMLNPDYTTEQLFASFSDDAIFGALATFAGGIFNDSIQRLFGAIRRKAL